MRQEIQAENKGLKAMRASTGKDGPTYACPNCKCTRRSPCTCMRKKDKKEN